jgi:hypothetical protein
VSGQKNYSPIFDNKDSSGKDIMLLLPMIYNHGYFKQQKRQILDFWLSVLREKYFVI